MATWISALACLSPFPCENNLRYRIRKHEISKKAKIDTLAFSVYASMLMHLINNSWLTTKSVVSFKKDYKIALYPSKIPWLFSFHIYAVVKTHITCRFLVFKGWQVITQGIDPC